MKVLFDNNVPKRLRRSLMGHEVRTAREIGWHELENGYLLSMAERSVFDVMVTGDKNLSYRQNLANRKIALIVLSTTDRNIVKLNPASIAAALVRVSPGSFEQLNMKLGHG